MRNENFKIREIIVFGKSGSGFGGKEGNSGD
jgi:hypothetical protein